MPLIDYVPCFQLTPKTSSRSELIAFRTGTDDPNDNPLRQVFSTDAPNFEVPFVAVESAGQRMVGRVITSHNFYAIENTAMYPRADEYSRTPVDTVWVFPKKAGEICYLEAFDVIAADKHFRRENVEARLFRYSTHTPFMQAECFRLLLNAGLVNEEMVRRAKYDINPAAKSEHGYADNSLRRAVTPTLLSRVALR